MKGNKSHNADHYQEKSMMEYCVFLAGRTGPYIRRSIKHLLLAGLVYMTLEQTVQFTCVESPLDRLTNQETQLLHASTHL